MTSKYPIGKVELLLGWVCNQNCIFCSVGHKLSQVKKVKSFNEVKKDIERAKKIKAKTISFSGGEPTIIPYLIDAIKYANKFNFEKIELQTNGRMLDYEDFAKDILDAGANRFLFSIHGDNSKLHDSLVMAEGAFEQAIQGIKNVKKFGDKDLDLRTSTVIVKQNYKILPRIVKFLLKFNLRAIHTGPAIVDGHAYTNKETVVPKLSEITPYVHEAIEEAWKKDNEIYFYSMPYCLMQGYEKTIAELGTADTLLDAPDFEASIQEHRHDDRSKRKDCKNCKYDILCLGIWKRYVRMYGLDELKPVLGEKIKDSSVFWS
jgi:MoaA/NifB/PqqE/SkfB family radical SAM enzyme